MSQNAKSYSSLEKTTIGSEIDQQVERCRAFAFFLEILDTLFSENHPRQPFGISGSIPECRIDRILFCVGCMQRTHFTDIAIHGRIGRFAMLTLAQCIKLTNEIASIYVWGLFKYLYNGLTDSWSQRPMSASVGARRIVEPLDPVFLVFVVPVLDGSGTVYSRALARQ